MGRYAVLQSDWTALLGRRAAIRDSLSVYDEILEAWARWPEGCVTPLRLTQEECLARWERLEPLAVGDPPDFPLSLIEEPLRTVLEIVAGLGESHALIVERLALDLGEEGIGCSHLLSRLQKGTAPRLEEATDRSSDLLAFIAYAAARPAIEEYFALVRPFFAPDRWDRGECPFCGVPPAFVEFGDEGKRGLVCHLCGATWHFSRLRCPACDNQNPKSLIRLAAEGAEEGYVIEACELCRAYLKGVDRRVRWDLASPLIEDWGSPHLDLIAHRQGYWRASPSLIQLAFPE